MEKARRMKEKQLINEKKMFKQNIPEINTKDNKRKRIIDVLIISSFWKIIRKCLILVNNFIFNKYIKLKLYYFVFTNYIRKSKKEYLLNKKSLNKLLSQIGFYNAAVFFGDRSISLKYLKTGLLMLQYPQQFSKYLLTLSKFNIQTYLEIGTGFGGSFITTVEYLMKLNPNFKYAIGMDVNKYVSMDIYARFNKKIEFLVMDSQSSDFKKYIERSPSFDLVFIDATHSYKDCRNEFEIVKEKAKMIAFHDILEREIEDVWKYIKEFFQNEYNFLEFTDQYLKNGRYLGIGLLIRKDI